MLMFFIIYRFFAIAAIQPATSGLHRVEEQQLVPRLCDTN